MRLIDADELKRSISQHNKIPRIFQQVINAQPTVYDIDKVVEQLEELKIDIERGCVAVNNEKCNKYFDCGVCTMDRVIEIVKHVGVGTDDACEWVSASDGEFIQNPHTKRLYSNEPSMKNVYCNTCGKKIKVVE